MKAHRTLLLVGSLVFFAIVLAAMSMPRIPADDQKKMQENILVVTGCETTGAETVFPMGNIAPDVLGRLYYDSQNLLLVIYVPSPLNAPLENWISLHEWRYTYSQYSTLLYEGGPVVPIQNGLGFAHTFSLHCAQPPQRNEIGEIVEVFTHPVRPPQ